MQQSTPYGFIDLPEESYSFFRHAGGAPEVNLEQLSGRCLVHRLDFAYDVDACIVEHDVNSAKCLFCLRKCGGDVGVVGHIHFNGEELGGWISRCELGEGLGLAKRGDNFVSNFELILGHGVTETGRGTGDCSVQ